MKRLIFAAFAVLLILLAGCAGMKPAPQAGMNAPVQTTPPGTAEAQPAPAETAPPVQAEPNQPALTQPSAEAQPGAEVIEQPLPKPVMSGNRAVIALLDRAELDISSGKRDAAGAALERALRIEPRNPWLWHQLAQVRLAQGQYAQAGTLARKSNSFAGKQYRLLADNWQVIGQSRIGEGNTAGAEEAFKRASELAQQARAAYAMPAAAPAPASAPGAAPEPGTTSAN